jgi:hypothetical protein
MASNRKIIQTGRTANIEEVTLPGSSERGYFVRCRQARDGTLNQDFVDREAALAYWRTVENGSAKPSL